MFQYFTDNFDYKLTWEKFIIFQELISEINLEVFKYPLYLSIYSYGLYLSGIIWIDYWFKKNIKINKKNIEVKD